MPHDGAHDTAFGGRNAFFHKMIVQIVDMIEEPL